MVTSIYGKKVGMTQVFDKNRRVVPVTIVDVGGWFVTQIKTEERDGYNALQVGLPRKKYQRQVFDNKWLRMKKKFFSFLREVVVDQQILDDYSCGDSIKLEKFAAVVDDLVIVTGTSRGKGFQGVIKRHGFARGPVSHGSTFHRRPGSIGNMCSQGKVIKGKKLPGHDGALKVTHRGLRVVRADLENNCVFVKGAVPGSKDSLVLISKQG